MSRGLIRMGWRDAIFVHWPLAAETLAERLPAGIEPRTFDGRAWLGVVAFVMRSIRPRGIPAFAGLTFGEANLRTYVAGEDGGEGIYFFHLDAADPLGVLVARTLYRLPYYRATMRVERSDAVDGAQSTEGVGRRIEFTSNRVHPGVPDAHLDVGYGPKAEPSPPKPGSLAEFLVENYRFYVAGGDVRLDADSAGGVAERSRNERVFAGDVAHDPWPLARADIDLRSTNFLAVDGLKRPDADPVAHYSPGVDVTAGRIRRVE